MSGHGKRRFGPELSDQVIRELFSYDPETGYITRHGKQFKDGRITLFVVPRLVGEYFKPGHRRQIRIAQSLYVTTHLIWYLQTGHWPTPAEEVDHRNRVPTDDWWDNLRLTDRRGNQLNTRRCRHNDPDRYQGVLKRGHGKWSAWVRNKSGGQDQLGYFDTEVDAAKARDVAAVRLWGNDVYLNFPEELP